MQINNLRSRLKTVVLIAALIFLITGCTKTEIKNLSSKGKNIICFGDSITFGYGVNPGEDYPTALARIAGIPVLNKGIDGDTTLEALKRIRTDCLDNNPYLVIVEFTGNDFLKKVPFETTVNNTRKIIRSIQAQGSIVAVADISSGFFLREYRKALARVAHEEGAVFIPAILGGIITNPSMKSDFFHPNAEGYKIIAGRVYRAISPYLKQKK